MIDIIRNTLRILFRKKGRTFLTIIGISIGITSVILISNISQCGSSALSDEIDGLGMGGLTVSLKNNSAPLTKKELKTIQSLPYVEYAMPIMFENTDVYVRDEKSSVYLWGINQYAKDVISLNLIYGRFINAGDIKSTSKICLVDQKFADSHYGTDNIVGRKIIIINNGISDEYKVVGILKTGSGLLQNMMGTYIPNFVYIPYTTMQTTIHSSNYSQIAIRLKSNIDSEKAGKDIIKTIERNSNVHDVYTVTNLAQQKENLNNIMNIFTIILSSVGAVSLLVANLNIMNVMLVSVTERTREIGIKKSIGASSKNIIAEFLSEAAILSVMGCVCGIFCGMIISLLGTLALGLTFKPRIDIIIFTMLLSIITGSIFGIYPAVKASKLKPVDALRTY
ncbi:MAG: ABC transporter permease [Clostridia bacterium]|nr:ABC transporter permease [Clostridia bacterium]